MQTQIERLPLSATVPTLAVAENEIATVNALLAELAQMTPVVWFGPRTEPQVQLEWLVGRGCEKGLAIRAGTEANFDRLDAVLARSSVVPYLSQNRLFGLTFPRDLGGMRRAFMVGWRSFQRFGRN